jgi:hypothetical protein
MLTTNRTLTSHVRRTQTMESAKSSGVVEDYSISQTTLEQVFIQFAQDQTETEARESAYRNR